MKKKIIALFTIALFYEQNQACSWYDPEFEYFTLFTQNIIKDKSYSPFLLTYSSKFYSSDSKIADDNISAWRTFFGNKLTYAETENLVYKVSLQDLQNLKKGNSQNALLQKLGSNFYQKNNEAIDYLIEAKYLEPFMMIGGENASDSFYVNVDENAKNATDLDYQKTVQSLTSLYQAAKNPEIKLRYGYQLVRFNHYNHMYQQAVEAFDKYVEPLKRKTAPYYMAMRQYAGALRGMEKKEEANWYFFQVFLHSNSNKESAYTSMTLTNAPSFNDLLKRSSTNEEKNMAYFLLGYQDFNNPLPMMEKMFALDPNSEMLKVLGARAVNELERSYLPLLYTTDTDATKTPLKNTDGKSITKEAEKETSWWQKIVNFFKNLFSSKNETKIKERNNDLSDSDYLKNPNRIPFYTENNQLYSSDDNQQGDYIDDLEEFVEKTSEKNADEYWKITLAYLKFLKKDYQESSSILADIKTNNKEYISQIDRMKMLNDIVSQPKIDSKFEEHLAQQYSQIFEEKKKSDSTDSYYDDFMPDTGDFIRDILANRYFLQGEDGKSFLMSNSLSDLQYNPDMDLVKKVEAFVNKTNKNTFEKNIISKNIDQKGDLPSFFNLIYGDAEMRNANFEEAKNYYSKAQNFAGIPRESYVWDNNKQDYVPLVYDGKNYDGFHNVSDLVFGHNVWESFGSSASQSMKSEDFIKDFAIIKPKMSKLELANILIELKKLGNSNTEKAAQANQLIGNVLYNTSSLGYFRQYFVMDIDNSQGPKFDFEKNTTQYNVYYKNYAWKSFVKPDNFDLAIQYYSKALKSASNVEQKARITFQLASAEQGKYYQWETNQPSIEWSDKDWEAKTKKRDEDFAKEKNAKFRTYFSQLKSQYGNTATSQDLMGSCSYYHYFMKK